MGHGGSGLVEGGACEGRLSPLQAATAQLRDVGRVGPGPHRLVCPCYAASPPSRGADSGLELVVQVALALHWVTFRVFTVLSTVLQTAACINHAHEVLWYAYVRNEA